MKQDLIAILTKAGATEAHLFTPENLDPNKPTILFFMDIFGVRPALIDMAKRMTDLGHKVLLPNLFYRSHKLPLIPSETKKEDLHTFFPTLKPMMTALTPELLLEDAKYYLETLDSPKVVIAGYCLGGRLGLLTAAAYPEKVVGLASFHAGGLTTDGLPKMKADLYFGHADKDSSMPIESIERLEEALKSYGYPSKSEVYTGAQHGFTMKDLQSYSSEADARHWQNLEALLHRLK